MVSVIVRDLDLGKDGLIAAIPVVLDSLRSGLLGHAIHVSRGTAFLVLLPISAER
jgi:hypothetical protein